jgi:hypothetical protein
MTSGRNLPITVTARNRDSSPFTRNRIVSISRVHGPAHPLSITTRSRFRLARLLEIHLHLTISACFDLFSARRSMEDIRQFLRTTFDLSRRGRTYRAAELI